MASDNKSEDTETLLEIYHRHLNKKFSRTLFSDSEDHYILKHLETMASTHPAEAIHMAIILTPRTGHHSLMYNVVAPFAYEIPDENLELQRNAAAYLCGTAQLYWAAPETLGIAREAEDGLDKHDVEVLQAIAFLFKKLERSAGQDLQVQQLADAFYKDYLFCVEERNRNYIGPFTTAGKAAATAASGLKPSQ